VPKTPFVWKAELGGAPDSAFSAQLGSVTYYAVTRSYCHPAYSFLHRESLVCRFNCTVASTASIRSRPFAMA
jgi:hypothetical protein